MQLNIHEVKLQLPMSVERALKGEEVVISKAGKLLVKVDPYEPKSARR